MAKLYLSAHKEPNMDCECNTKIVISSDYNIREFVAVVNVLCAICDLVCFPNFFFQLRKKTILGSEIFCMISA